MERAVRLKGEVMASKGETDVTNVKRELLIELLATIGDNRTKEEKSEAAGFAKGHIYKLQKDPEFLLAVTDRHKRNLALIVPRVMGNLMTASDKGDTKASELILKANGDVQGGGHSTVVNVQQTNEAKDNEPLEDTIDGIQSRINGNERVTSG